MKIYYFCNKKKINMDKITGPYMTGLAISFRRAFPSSVLVFTKLRSGFLALSSLSPSQETQGVK